MPTFCLSLHLHQPARLKHYTFFDIGESAVYENTDGTRDFMNTDARGITLPTLRLLLRQITEYQGDYRVALSLSGLFMEYCDLYAPEVMDTLKALADTGSVEFLNGTYYHSLASLISAQEFREQIILHSSAIQTCLGQVPTAFANSGLIASDDIAREVENLGYQVMLAAHTGMPSPGHVYQPASCALMKLLLVQSLPLKNPAAILGGHTRGEVVALSRDLPGIGHALGEDPVFMDFLEMLPGTALSQKNAVFKTPTQVAREHPQAKNLSPAAFLSGVPPIGNLSPWLGNDMQKDALDTLYHIENEVKSLRDPALLRTWRILQDADHFLAMGAPAVGEGFKLPLGSFYDAYINYMNILTDFTERIGSRE